MAATGFVTEIAIADRIVRWCHRDQRSEFTRRAAQRALRISRVDGYGGAAAAAGGQRLREVGGSAARGAHRAQAIRHVPRESSRLAARFCQFCPASSVRRRVVSGRIGTFCRFCRSVTTQIKAILSKGWLVG